MSLNFLSEARSELYEAVAYYESKQPGLGWRFRSETLKISRLIMEQPLLWREKPGGYRRVNFPVFPYYLAYFIRGDLIIVAAVAHGSRHPEYWKQRLPDQ